MREYTPERIIDAALSTLAADSYTASGDAYDEVLIESQPFTRVRGSLSVKVLSYALYTYFKIRAPHASVRMVSPQGKLCVWAPTFGAPPYSAPSRAASLSAYACRKKDAIALAEHILQQHSAADVATLRRHRKKDDLADCFLQAAYEATRPMQSTTAQVCTAQTAPVHEQAPRVRSKNPFAQSATAADIRAALREVGAPVSGRKAELLERLQQRRPYGTCTVRTLKKELRSRNLPVSGSRRALEDRLTAHATQ